MRTYCISLVLILVAACNQRNADQSTFDRQAAIESTAIRFSETESSGSGDSLRNPYHPAYLTDLQFHEIGALYLSDSIVPLDNLITFHLMDTLITCSSEDRSWFMSIFEVILLKADGALAESAGLYTWKFIRTHPGYFTAYADTADPDIISKWAMFTSYEMYAAIPEDSLDIYSDQMMNDLKEYIDKENKGLLKFADELHSYTKTMIED